jgi:hypothetical protein
MTTLDDVLDRLLPDDGYPGAAAFGIADAVAALVPDVDDLLELIDGHESVDDALRALEAAGDPVFAAVVAAAHAVFYADPRSWPALGYTTNVPGRP